jgi:hypothetical protein
MYEPYKVTEAVSESKGHYLLYKTKSEKWGAHTSLRHMGWNHF